jgi:hypothetical protein
MLDETQARLMFGNIKNFSYLNITFAHDRQSTLAKGYRPLTEFILSQIFSTQEKNCFAERIGGIFHFILIYFYRVLVSL